jgi:hypothetical protein
VARTRAQWLRGIERDGRLGVVAVRAQRLGDRRGFATVLAMQAMACPRRSAEGSTRAA